MKCPTCGNEYVSGDAGGLCPRCLAQMAEHPTDPPVVEPALEPGRHFQGMEVLSLLARGGMGIVYRVRQLSTGQLAALKVLPRKLADDVEFRRRFQREAELAVTLNHPNIVSVYDFGVEGQVAYLVTALVQGPNLRELIRANRVGPAEVLALVPQICDALDYAHSLGVIHRDIKPENILLELDRQIKITDFGLAMTMNERDTVLTGSGYVVGTPHYMSPEQLERPSEVDHRADIYSLGVVLYEMLTGELPLGRFDPPSKKAGLDARWDSVVFNALANNPEERYQHAGEVREALAALSGTPAPRPKEVRTPLPRYARNTPVRCPCGWTFYVPGVDRGMATCPSCRSNVSIGAPTARATVPEPVEPDPVPSRPGPNWLNRGLAMMAGVVVLVLAVSLFVGGRGCGEEPVVVRYWPVDETPAPIRPAPPAVPPTEIAPLPPFQRDIPNLHRALDEAVARSNMAAIVSSVLLHLGRTDDYDTLQARLGAYNVQVRTALEKLAVLGEPVPDPAYCRPGDRLASLGTRALDPKARKEFSEALLSWLRNFKPGVQETCTVFRDPETVQFQMHFPQWTRDLNALSQVVDVVLGMGDHPGVEEKTPVAPVHPTPEVEPIVATLAARINQKLEALPAHYRTAIPALDRERMKRLLAANAAMATSSDVDFLRLRILGELIPRFEEEVRQILRSVQDLERRLSSASKVDVVHFKDGRRLEGTVEEETEKVVKIRSRLGAVTFPAGTVLRIERGKGAAVEFMTRYAEARGNRERLEALSRWCAGRNLDAQNDLVAWSLLELDPGHPWARARLEYVKGKTGAWEQEEQARLSEGKIQWRGRWYAPDELGSRLRAAGYVFLNGIWCAKTSYTYRVDNLYRDRGRLLFHGTGTSIVGKLLTKKDMVYDINRRAWVPRTRKVQVAQYIGVLWSGRSSGTCHLEIRVPGDLVECRIRAKGEVAKLGDYLAVSVVNSLSDPLATPLYTLNSPQENRKQFDVSDKVRGRSQFFIRAVLRGSAMFLPSDRNDLGVLEVRCTIGKPLERINAALGLVRRGPTMVPFSEFLRPGVPRVGSPPSGTPSTVPEEQVGASMAAIAEYVVRVHASLTGVIDEMIRRSVGYRYTMALPGPIKLQAIVVRIKTPLAPRLEALPKSQLLEVGELWGSATELDRREFAAYYGLWCARYRADMIK